MNPGQGTVCRDCRQFNQAAWDRGHPSPCRLFAWSGSVHYSPVLSEDGRQCEDFWQRGQKTRAENHGLETKCPETCHGENAPDPVIDDSAADSTVAVDVATNAVDGRGLVSGAIEPAEDGEPAGCRVTGGETPGSSGTNAAGLGKLRSNVGQELIDS